MKTCSNTNCKQANPQKLTNFSGRKDRKSGLKSRCKSCLSSTMKEYRETPEGRFTEKQYRESSEGKAIKTTINKEHNQIPKVKAAKKVYRESSAGKMALREYRQSPEGRSKIYASNAKRRAKKLKATPPWLTEEHLKESEAFYAESIRLTKETGISHHVDHKVPLQGKSISGLHVPWNLQILVGPGPDGNCSKNDKFDPIEYNRDYFLK